MNPETACILHTCTYTYKYIHTCIHTYAHTYRSRFGSSSDVKWLISLDYVLVHWILSKLHLSLCGLKKYFKIDWDCMRLVGLKCTCKYMQCLLTMQKNFARNTWIIWCCACSIHLVCTFISFYCYSWHMTLTQRVPKVILYPLCHIFFVKTSLF